MSNDYEDNPLAGIQYLGIPGISRDCLQAVMRLMQCGDQITRVRILSSSAIHCLLLTVNDDCLVAIKSGFGSGYVGEGPRSFSYILELMDAHGVRIDEYDVDPWVVERLDNSALTKVDIKNLNDEHPVHPRRWHKYIFPKHEKMRIDQTLWEEFPPLVPYAIIDSRIIDLAISFWDNPDEKLLTGYRRLEGLVRKRTGITDSGAVLFSEAFLSSKAKLGWKSLDESEQKGRAQLFTSAFMAHRNPRAHREDEGSSSDQLAEFLLLNHLYRLEKSASERSDSPP